MSIGCENNEDEDNIVDISKYRTLEVDRINKKSREKIYLLLATTFSLQLKQKCLYIGRNRRQP